jgi:hypothetical protein
VVVGGALVGVWLAGCASDPHRGYVWGSSYSNSVASVSVPVWKNQTFATGLETQLTEAVVKEIQRTTPWVVTTGRAADTTLLGTITNVEYERLSSAPGIGLVQEQAVRVEIQFDWVDNRTGEKLLTRDRFVATSVFVPSPGTGERAEIGQRDAIQELARDLVRELRSDW